jgi:hypothetical protein
MTTLKGQNDDLGRIRMTTLKGQNDDLEGSE